MDEPNCQLLRHGQPLTDTCAGNVACEAEGRWCKLVSGAAAVGYVCGQCGVEGTLQGDMRLLKLFVPVGAGPCRQLNMIALSAARAFPDQHLTMHSGGMAVSEGGGGGGEAGGVNGRRGGGGGAAGTEMPAVRWQSQGVPGKS